MGLAGGPDDRWLRRWGDKLKLVASDSGREESPDTVARCRKASSFRATRLVTPGDAVEATGRKAAAPKARHGQCHREYTAGAAYASVTGRRKTCDTSSTSTLRKVPTALRSHQARVKRWGKSPPVRSRDRTHGKPRVVQGQIGGESWPGSFAPSAQARSAHPESRFSRLEGHQPSGRPLEARCEPCPRGMIVAAW